MVLIYILIILFICLIGYQIILAFSGNKIIEGLENGETMETTDYQPYEGGSSADQALSLAKQNEYNIEYLHGKVKEIGGVKDEIDKMKLDMGTMQGQVDGLASQTGELGTQLTGGATTEDLNGVDVSSGDPTAQAEADIAAEDGATDQDEQAKLPL
jgi:hypothetical protein